MGDYERAEPLLKKAVQIDKDVLGEKHLDYAIQLNNLAGHYGDIGRPRERRAIIVPSVSNRPRSIDLTAAVQSERQQLRMADTLHKFSRRLSFECRTRRRLRRTGVCRSARVEGNGLRTATKHAAMRQEFRKELSPDVPQLFDQLNAASRELANQSRITPRARNRNSLPQKLADLSDTIERLQRELAAKSDEFRKQRQQEHRTPDDIRRALPPDAALIDLLEYQHVAPAEEKGKGPSFERRLVAFVVRPDRPVERIELGPAATIAEIIEQWRTTYGAASATLNIDSGQELRRLVWEKLEPHLQGCKTLLFSPDGATARFPWPACRENARNISPRRAGRRRRAGPAALARIAG